MKAKFYQCPICGRQLTILKDSGSELVCCTKPMLELKANSTEAATEKHIPVLTVSPDGSKVTAKVGSVPHPMTKEHLIEWVCLETTNTIQIVYLNAQSDPEAVFLLQEGEKPVAVYEHCNLHGLWVKEV